MNFDVIKASGLSGAEVGRIVGVSGAMMWKYRNMDKSPRHKYRGLPLRLRMEVTLEVLQALVDAKRLPRPELAHSPNVDPERVRARAELLEGITQTVDKHVAAKLANQ